MAHDIFISHSAKDKTIADAICARLESEGVRCWIAPRDVTAGMEWGAAIVGAIRQARIMVLVFSANANASPQIRKELERAVHHDVVILPFRIENVVPDESLEYFIGNVHWLDALTPPVEAHLRNLADTVRVLLDRMKMRDGRAPAAAPPREASPAAAIPAPSRATEAEIPGPKPAPPPETETIDAPRPNADDGPREGRRLLNPGKTKWGFNSSPAKCPTCGKEQPRGPRMPRDAYEAMWGGRTCSGCGTKMDKWGRVRA